MPKVIINEEYDFPLNKGTDKAVMEMRQLTIAELRLWIIQELSCIDSECWWLIDIGVAILKDKMKEVKGEC